MPLPVSEVAPLILQIHKCKFTRDQWKNHCRPVTELEAGSILEKYAFLSETEAGFMHVNISKCADENNSFLAEVEAGSIQGILTKYGGQ